MSAPTSPPPSPGLFEAPDFWISDYDAVNAYLDTLRSGRVWGIGRSAGGRRIRAVAYGEREPIERTATRSSALASGHPESFFDPARRSRPVLVVISTIHGLEMEGCVASLNLTQVMESGVDLRGRHREELREAAGKMRLVVVPLAQPDGRVRSAVRHLVGASRDELFYYGQGFTKDGEILRSPECLRRHPMPVDDLALLGGYYNDAGVNIQHDDFFGPRLAPETRALLDLVRDETPDCVVVLHSCLQGPFIAPPDAYIPEALQFRQAQIGAIVRQRHARDGLRPGGGAATAARGPFYFHTALHHASGALPLLFEFPHGLEPKPFTHDEILDIGFGLFEEWVRFGLTNRFVPREAWQQ